MRHDGPDDPANELYIDVVEIEEIAPPPSATMRIDSAEFRRFLNDFNNDLYVIIQSAAEAKRHLSNNQRASHLIQEIANAADRVDSAIKSLQSTHEVPPFQSNGRTILVADDQDSVRDLMRDILRHQGFSVLVASNGMEALDIWHSHTETIELVVADVMMNPVDGYELVRQILIEKAGIKAIYISGSAVDHSRTMSGTRFLMKPKQVATELVSLVWGMLRSQ